MEPQQQIIRRSVDILKHLIHLRWVLPRETGSRTSTIEARPIHADGVGHDAEPLTVTVVLLRDWVGAEVSVENIGEGLDTQVAAVILVCWPRAHGDRVDDWVGLVCVVFTRG